LNVPQYVGDTFPLSPLSARRSGTPQRVHLVYQWPDDWKTRLPLGTERTHEGGAFRLAMKPVPGGADVHLEWPAGDGDRERPTAAAVWAWWRRTLGRPVKVSRGGAP